MAGKIKVAWRTAMIGAGVAGIYASYCCGVSGFSCVFLIRFSVLEGNVWLFYPDKKVYGASGFFNIPACNFIDSLKSQAASFKTTAALLSEKITQISFENETFILNSEYSAKHYNLIG